jgi:hypothetical protein
MFTLKKENANVCMRICEKIIYRCYGSSRTCQYSIIINIARKCAKRFVALRRRYINVKTVIWANATKLYMRDQRTSVISARNLRQ